MSEDQKPKPAIVEAAQAEPTDKDSDISKHERNVEMFKLWLMGAKMTDIAKKFEITHSAVSQIAKKYKWKTLLNKYEKRLYRNAMGQLKSWAPQLQSILEADVKKIVTAAIKDEKALTTDERAHIRALWDRALKEIRLDDGNPTDIPQTDRMQIELILPPGVKRFGVIPPNPAAMITEKKPEVAQEDSIDIEDIVDGAEKDK